MKPEISVIMCVYKPKIEYLSRALNSYSEQTYKNFSELIFVIDDKWTQEYISYTIIGSAEDPPAKIIKIPSTPNNITANLYMSNVISSSNPPMNVGLTRALNVGISYAQGKYICKLDDDNWYEPEKLQKQFIFMENNPEIDLCYTDFIFHDETKNPPVELSTICPEANYDILKSMNYICHDSIMFRKDRFAKIGFYDETYKRCQDYELYLRALSKGFKFARLPGFLTHYRFHKNCLTNRHAKEGEKYRDLIQEKYSGQIIK